MIRSKFGLKCFTGKYYHSADGSIPAKRARFLALRLESADDALTIRKSFHCLE